MDRNRSIVLMYLANNKPLAVAADRVEAIWESPAPPGEVLRLLCGGCFDDEQGEVPSVPIPNNLIQFQCREEGDDAASEGTT
jgi:hypothetical protein